jgi:DNA-binding transcriptional LysR family regulator
MGQLSVGCYCRIDSTIEQSDPLLTVCSINIDNSADATHKSLPMELTSLVLLVEIVEAGNLSVAARKLKTSRANISYHLSQLEKAVGMKLLRRTTRRMELTEIGQRLYQHGRSIQEELLAARESVETLGHTLHGRIRVGVPSGYGQLVMAEWLIAFKRLYPDIVLDVLFETRVTDLLRDRLDISIRVMAEPPPSLVARELGSVHYVACAARAYVETHGLPVEPEDLGRVPLLTSENAGQQLRVAAYQGDVRREIELHPTLISENFVFLRQAILAGIGVGLVPDYVVQESVREGAVLTALDNWRLSIFGSRLLMLYMPNANQPRAIRTFIDYVLLKARGSEVSASLPQ